MRRGHEQRDVLPHDLLAVVTKDLLGGRVERPHDALVVDGDDGVDGRVHDRRHPGLAFFERSFGLLLLRDVLENASNLHDLAILDDRHALCSYPFSRTFRTDDLQFQVEWQSPGDRIIHGPFDLWSRVVRVKT